MTVYRDLIFQERYNVITRQCCDLIDEKAKLQRQLDEAREHMRDIMHVCENFTGVTRPLEQIKGRCRSFLDHPNV